MNFFAVDISTGLTVASGAGRTEFFAYREIDFDLVAAFIIHPPIGKADGEHFAQSFNIGLELLDLVGVGRQ